jgi:hypothetical protein
VPGREWFSLKGPGEAKSVLIYSSSSSSSGGGGGQAHVI